MADMIEAGRRISGFRTALMAVLALVLLVWVALAIWTPGDEAVQEAVQAGPPPAGQAAATSGVDTTPPAVAAFLTFAETQTSPAAEAGPAHEYAAAGLRRLNAALAVIIEEKKVAAGHVRQRLAELRRTAERIQRNGDAMGRVNRVRHAFMTAANLLSALQQNHWPTSKALRNDLEQVRSAAVGLDPQQPLPEQRPTMREFFERAAGVVRRMAA